MTGLRGENCMTEKIDILFFEVDNPPKRMTIDKTADSIKELLGGTFQERPLSKQQGNPFFVYFRPDQISKGKLNRIFGGIDLYGNFIILRSTTGKGASSLTEDDFIKLKKLGVW